MAETRNLALPLVAAAQAQKHVTVNEALLRLDALARLRVASAAIADPPADADDGACYAIAAGAGGAWAGRSGQIAVWSNGGWDFAWPQPGWSAWNEDTGEALVFDGLAWVGQGAGFGAGGSATICRIIEADHVIGAGASSVTGPVIPAGAQVIAVSLRVIEAVTGAGISSFSLGVAADAARYGSGIGTGLNAWGKGITGAPVTYYTDTTLVLTPDAGVFAGGKVRLAIHLTEVLPPRAV